MMFRKARNTDASMSSLQGFLDVSYDQLVSAFGEPHHDGDGYKVDAEWVLKFEDGTIATIYNYKTGKNYNGDDGEEVKDIRDWHVGGFNKNAAILVAEALGIVAASY